MEFFIYWKIATGLETLSSRVEYKMARGARKFCFYWNLADTE